MDPTRTAPDSRDELEHAELTAQLWLVHPARDVRTIGQGLVAGRSGPLERWLSEDAKVSREHARLHLERGSWFITDLDSRNGTKVDGQRLAPSVAHPLGASAILRLGDVLLVFTSSAERGEGDDDLELPGRSPAMQRLRAQLSRAASLSEPLLVLGETGSGKEYVVRWLHRSGAQASGPFVEVNCAQLSREFARTELFGIEPKTASGVDGRKGLVSAAHGGTLFLDEVGDLPEEVQPELLRFLQDGSFVRLGSHTIERSNARVIAATHRDLSGEVERGAFRRDLYARLTIARAPLVVPPLRERAVDILDWAARFLRGRSLTAGAAEALLTHPWLANLRELERVIRTAEGEVPAGEPVRRRHLELEVPEAHEQAEAEANGRPERTEAPELTKARLIEVLAEEKGVIVRVAARLGIDRRSVYRACERFDVDHTAYRDEKEA